MISGTTIQARGRRDDRSNPVIGGKISAGVDAALQARPDQRLDHPLDHSLDTRNPLAALPGAAPAGSAAVSLAERLAFEQLLGDLSAHFADLPGERVAEEIGLALRRLLDFLGFDRCTFVEFADPAVAEATGDDPNGAAKVPSSAVLCSVVRDGFAPTLAGAAPDLPWYQGELRAGRLVVLHEIPAELPAQALVERDYCARLGLKSNLGIPLLVGGRILGAIAFTAFQHTRAWPEDLIVRLKILGEVFAQSLARARHEQALKEALAEITRLKGGLEAENRLLRQSRGGCPLPTLTSRSPRFNQVLGEIAQVAPTSATVLLLGETGSGKEVIANAIHAMSACQARPMVRVNCAALPASLIEAELFGREKGAYTGALARQMGRFEQADGGALFLDEVGELPLELQPKLLRVLQDRSFERVGGTRTLQVKVRLIAATNRNLARMVAEGDFREDLYYRLNVFPVTLPPLRERPEDIPLLAWQFVEELRATMGKPIEHISEDSMAALLAYTWPGNVRELRNLIERAMILARGPTLHINIGALASAPAPVTASPSPEMIARDSLAARERAHILEILELTGWRIRGAGGAAERLDLKPTTLESRMKRLGIRRP
ncbi:MULTISPECIES: sigma 54-interacting transcriptional regulator [Thiorhodovibrio]|uniref:sigma 54-interacting transcriptional regulator n=1 Tax=Thiorhodovibrio TaxID=61593 RepID=UPI001F5D0152|nr:MULTISPECIES: sigma 54-interacting transcriptional regulator [Thiorhodovibrio]WPL14885.1 Formate hydrogenlyase transcriptional activator [Thiorhodovibrio litoralis]